MNFLKLLIFCLFSALLSCKKNTQENTSIIPQPNTIEYKEGTFEITEKTIIVADDTAEAKKIADDLIYFFNKNFKIKLKTSAKEQNNAILLVKSNDIDNKEAYKLSVSKKGVSISGNSYQGIFYGMQTLKQMLTPKNIIKEPIKNIIKEPILNYVHISDAPEFGWRGMMLDVSRHFFPKDSIKKVIDILAMHKMNKFHWHLVDGIGWRIQIDKYPELIKKGAWRKVKTQKNHGKILKLLTRIVKVKSTGAFILKTI